MGAAARKMVGKYVYEKEWVLGERGELKYVVAACLACGRVVPHVSSEKTGERSYRLRYEHEHPLIFVHLYSRDLGYRRWFGISGVDNPKQIPGWLLEAARYAWLERGLGLGDAEAVIGAWVEEHAKPKARRRKRSK
jgi:hypothetical protein